MSETRCDNTDLVVSMCGCPKHLGVSSDDDRRHLSERSMTAQYWSACPWCGDRIAVGDLIHLIDGEWVCDQHTR